MIRDLKPYPAYKDSGVPWLGEVPAHWEVRRVRNIVEMRVSNVDKHSKEGEEPVRLCNYVDVYKHDRIRANMEFMKATASAEEIERFRLEHGDVLITKDSEAWDDIGVPALVESSAPDLISGYHLALLRPKQSAEGAFLLRALQSRPVAYQFHVEAKGVTRYGLSHHAIKSTSVPLPPLAEQAAIVRFLDYMDRRIRRYIRAKQKLIKLLEEYKQALISQAVTGRIDVRTGQPYPAYKPSGVEWLGEVPAHWEVRRLKTLCRMKAGANITNQSIEPSGDFPVYGGNGVRGYTSDFTHEGEFILIGRQGALCGNVHLVQGRFWASEHAVVVSLYGGHDLQWFAALLEAMNLNQYSMAAAQPGLAVERVLNLWAPVPHAEEQRCVCQYRIDPPDNVKVIHQ
ncbi:MAG: restriction endonuclease subunit S [Bacillota bacterium]|nr:restriction endonuclease subunit S [Bacillota bacterium]